MSDLTWFNTTKDYPQKGRDVLWWNTQTKQALYCTREILIQLVPELEARLFEADEPWGSFHYWAELNLPKGQDENT